MYFFLADYVVCFLKANCTNQDGVSSEICFADNDIGLLNLFHRSEEQGDECGSCIFVLCDYVSCFHLK